MAMKKTMPESSLMPSPRPVRSAEPASFTDLLASSLAFMAVCGSTPMSWSQPAISSLASPSWEVIELSSFVIPARIARNIPSPAATRPSMTTNAPSARGRPRLFILRTSGEATAATTAAVMTGRTITCVNAISQMAPTRKTPTPTSSHAVKPTSRSQVGAAKTPVSSLGSISTYWSSAVIGAGWPSPRLSRPRIRRFI